MILFLERVTQDDHGVHHDSPKKGNINATHDVSQKAEKQLTCISSCVSVDMCNSFISLLELNIRRTNCLRLETVSSCNILGCLKQQKFIKLIN